MLTKTRSSGVEQVVTIVFKHMVCQGKHHGRLAAVGDLTRPKKLLSKLQIKLGKLYAYFRHINAFLSENDFHPSDPVYNQRQPNRGRGRPNRGRGYQPPRQMTKGNCIIKDRTRRSITEDEERSERLRRYLKEKGRLEEDDNISRDMITTGGWGEERQEDSLHREMANGHHRREPTKNNYVKGGSRLSPMFDEGKLIDNQLLLPFNRR